MTVFHKKYILNKLEEKHLTIKIPGLDAEKGLDLFEDDVELYLIVLRSYADNTPPVLDKIRNVSAETLADYAIAVHGIKGTSTTIGAEEIRITAGKLEDLARAGDLNGVLAINDSFLKQTDDLINSIQSWFKQHDAGSS